MAYKCGALSLADDGYCYLCGTVHTHADIVRTRTPVRKKEIAKVEIKPEPIEWPTFDLGFKPIAEVIVDKVSKPFVGMSSVEIAQELVARFHDTFDVKISKVYFNNAKAFRHTFNQLTGVHKLYLGRKTLRYALTNGSYDYDAVYRRMGVTRGQYKGVLGVAWIVAHELAHALQIEEQFKRDGKIGNRKAGDVHNDHFVTKFKQVINEMVPELK